MPQQFDTRNRGSLFKNDKKESEKHPDYTGPGDVNGVEVRMAAWMRTSKKGTRYMSIAFTPAEEQAQFDRQAQQQAQPQRQQQGWDDDSDSLPF